MFGFAANSRRKENAARCKAKRGEILAMKRNLGQQLVDGELENLPELLSGLLSNDPTLKLECMAQFRKLLSHGINPPIDKVIALGAVPQFVQFLSLHDNPSLQLEAAWALTNIASGSSKHTRIVIEAGAVPLFVQLLASPNEDVREQVTTQAKPFFNVSL